ncbi:TetR/AcrR family transcriptional regulator [Microbacterium sp. SORGH_AS_0862]|uniref:TetR/AcrR family transcriptional regulator n=1 Tax=Microbacterium sp. SORGH_AS_0862 TaxID=3041789 RepID=UPI00279475E3|nr:TetR family transcriptional regulator [Microbacterium sp. SORGH_AS_0862]MDQ1203863.1 AcrR family transcriptional regulator [Microbacterium sp. SORGH_AS_0862]
MADSSLPTTARGIATRRRILDAAATEFAQVGFAGARMDRITAAADANKAQLYAYFGSKDGLFDAVIVDRVDASTDDVPFDADDLPGWAVRLYDQNLRHPELARLIAWTRLERRPTGRWFDGAQHEPKLAAVADAQAAGRLRSGEPVDLLVLVMGAASAWSPTSNVYTATIDEPDGEHDRRRALLRESIARIVAP